MRLSGWTRAYLALVALSMAGVGLAASGLDPGPWLPRVLAAATLALGFWSVARGLAPPGRRLRLVLGATTIGGLAELVGVATGYPFGSYAYTNRWFPVVDVPSLGFYPLLLPLAWFLVVGGCYALASRLARGHWPVPLTALLAALADALVIEPVMAGPLAYWRWDPPGPLPGGAPILNTLGWLGVSALAAAWVRRSRGDLPETCSEPVLVLGAFLALTGWIGLSGFSGFGG